MGSGSSNTTTTKAEPWKSARPGLEDILGYGKDLYESGGFSPTPYGGPRVAEQSPGTTGAYNSIVGRGPQSPSIWRTQAQLGGMIDGNPALAGMSKSNPMLAELMRRNPGLSAMMNGNEGLEGMAGGDPRLAAMARSDPRLAGLSQGDPRLARMTSGQDIYQDLGQVKQNALGSAIPAAMSMFTGNGMTDSSAAMDTVGRAATEAVAPIDYNAWQGAQDRALAATGQDNATRMQAIGLDDQTRLQAMGQDASTRLQAYGQNDQSKLQAFGQDAQTRLGAIGQNDQTRLQAAGLDQQGKLGAAAMMPGMQQASYLPAQMMAGAGAGRDAYNQQGIAALMQKWYEQQGQGAGNLQGYSGLVNQIAGQGGNQATINSGGGGFGQTMGTGALSGLGTFGALAGIPGIGMPMAIGGGILGGLAGMM